MGAHYGSATVTKRVGKYDYLSNGRCVKHTALGLRHVPCPPSYLKTADDIYRWRNEKKMIEQRTEWLMNALKEPGPTFDINPYLNMNKNNYSELVRRLFKDLGA